MMTRKEKTISLTIVGMALLATVMTMSLPTQVLALGHWNLDEDNTPNSGFAEDSVDSSGTTDNTNEVEEEDNSDEDNTTAKADDGEEEGSEDGINSNDKKEDSSHIAYVEFQGCLSNLDGSPTEQRVQDCMESSYSGIDSSDENTPTESTDDGDEDENAVNKDVSTDNTQDEDSGEE